MTRGLLAGGLLALALAAPVAARERIDKILLDNGDTVTGEIIALEAGRLSIRTAKLGTVNVDWPDVVGLVSVQYFEVVRTDGARFRGRLDVAEDDGALVVRGGPEVAEATIPVAEVAGIDQIGTTLWHGRRGYVDLGWNYSQRDQDTSFSLEAELALRVRRFRWVTDLTTQVSDDATSEKSRRDVLRSLLEIPAGTRNVALAWLAHERNDDLSLDRRETAAAVYGWVPARNSRGRLLVGPGLAQSFESYAGEEASQAVTSGVLLVAGDYYRFGGFGTRASLSVSWLPALSGPSRDRVEARAQLRQKLGSDFTISVSPYYSYDSRPPSALAAGEDWGWTASLGWMF